MLPVLDDTLVCGECGEFKLPTSDYRGAICPHGHGKVTLTKPDHYKYQAKLRGMISWLDTAPEIYEGKHGFILKSVPGIFKKLKRLKPGETAEYMGRDGDKVYAFERIAHDGHIPLSRFGGSIKDWLGNVLPDNLPAIADGRIIVRREEIGPKALERLLKVTPPRKLTTVPATLAGVLTIGEPAEALGVQGELFFACSGGTTYKFNRDFCAWLNRQLDYSEFRIVVLPQAAFLQLCDDGVLAAVAERENE